MNAITPPPMPPEISRIANSADRHLAWEFFTFFSRFEYALKRHKKYLKRDKYNAEPNWDLFAIDHAKSFNKIKSDELTIALEYYHQHPPKKQIQKRGKIDWSRPIEYNGKSPMLVWLLGVIRTVRNNLFHGGKFPLISISDPSRDRELIYNAITILNACLDLDPKVKSLLVEDIDL